MIFLYVSHNTTRKVETFLLLYLICNTILKLILFTYIFDIYELICLIYYSICISMIIYLLYFREIIIFLISLFLSIFYRYFHQIITI